MIIGQNIAILGDDHARANPRLAGHIEVASRRSRLKLVAKESAQHVIHAIRSAIRAAAKSGIMHPGSRKDLNYAWGDLLDHGRETGMTARVPSDRPLI